MRRNYKSKTKYIVMGWGRAIFASKYDVHSILRKNNIFTNRRDRLVRRKIGHMFQSFAIETMIFILDKFEGN